MSSHGNPENSRHDNDNVDDELSNDSMHSAKSMLSMMSTSTTTSLQDVELADACLNPQEAPSMGSTKDQRIKAIETMIVANIRQAREKLLSSSLQGMNPAVLCILITEAAERFAYYGFRASLVLYFTEELLMDDTTAISLFAFASYVSNFTPIFGAVLGDGKLGRFWTIVAFGFVYVFGLIVLTHAAFRSNHTEAQLKVKRIVTIIGLALICTGTGGIKPCVSIFGADQVNKKKEDDKMEGLCQASHPSDATNATSKMNPDELEKVRTFFSFFSMCINLGAVASFMIIPSIKGSLGFGAAFLVPTVFMCFAIVVFTSQRDKYVIRPHNPHGSSLYTTFRLCLWMLHNSLWENRFISKNFPSLEPGPIPLPSAVPTKSDLTVVEGMSLHIGHAEDDHTSASSISMSTLSRSNSRSISSQSRNSMSSRRTLDTADRASDHPLRCRSSQNDDIEKGLKAPSRSPSASSSMSPLRTSRGSAGPPPSVSSATLQTSDRYLAQQLSDAARALNVLPIFAMLPCFWMLYDQQGSVWTLQASRMNLYGIIQPEQINVLNPIGLFVMIPVFDKVIYPALQKREIDISPIRRMGWGMVMVSFAFYLSGIVEYVIDYRIQNELPPISVAWQIPQIGLMTVAEIFISVTGLEFAYSVSPDRLKSFVMAAYLSTIAKGDLWGAVLYSTVFRAMNKAVVLHIFAMLMMINLACYGYVVRSWELRHGVVSWSMFDKVLENESKKRPCWINHHSQYLNNTRAKTVEAEMKDDRSRGRGRWRRRETKKNEKASKQETGSKKNRELGSKKSQQGGRQAKVNIRASLISRC